MKIGFSFEGHVPGGNWVTVGFNPPLVRIFGGLERKLRCAQNIVFLHVFLLSSVLGLAKNVENLGFFDVDQSKTLQWSKLRFCVARRPGV